MKKDQAEVVKYYSEMPAIFEKLNEGSTIDPGLSRVLYEKDLKLISSEVGFGSAICADSNGNQYLVKRGSNTEKVMYTEVLPAIDGQNIPFKVLQFPELVSVVTREQQNFLLIKHIDGTNFNDTWDEISNIGRGGKGIKTDFASKVVDLIEDLSLIEYTVLAKFD